MDANDRSDRFRGGSTATAEDQPSQQRGPVHPAGHSGAGGDGTTPRTESAGEAVRGISQKLAELGEYAGYFISAKLDGLKVTARNLGVYAVLGIVGLIALSTLVTTAVVMLLVGLAMAIGKAFEPDQYWVGALIVSVVVLGGLAGGVIFGLKRLSNTSRSALVRKYEERQRQQRVRFGQDVRGREADAADEVARR
jgi:hypothetical protein